MSATVKVATRQQTCGLRKPMTRMDQRIPDLSDKELENLHANAVRLAQSGSERERERAESLLPLLGAAMAERQAARVTAQAVTRRLATEKRALARKAVKALEQAGVSAIAQ